MAPITTNWIPTEPDKYKVVQMEVRKVRVLLFGSTIDQHVAMASAHLTREGIEHETHKDEWENLKMRDFGNDYFVDGAGYAELKANPKELVLYGTSVGFETAIDPSWIEDIKTLFPTHAVTYDKQRRS